MPNGQRVNPSIRTGVSGIDPGFDQQQHEFEEAAGCFRCACVSRVGSEGRGEIVYCAEVGARTITLAWAWVEIQPCVYAIKDPMSIESNFRLLDQTGRPLSTSRRAVVLNNAVRKLDWWAEINQH